MCTVSTNHGFPSETAAQSATVNCGQRREARANHVVDLLPRALGLFEGDPADMLDAGGNQRRHDLVEALGVAGGGVVVADVDEHRPTQARSESADDCQRALGRIVSDRRDILEW